MRLEITIALPVRDKSEMCFMGPLRKALLAWEDMEILAEMQCAMSLVPRLAMSRQLLNMPQMRFLYNRTVGVRLVHHVELVFSSVWELCPIMYAVCPSALPKPCYQVCSVTQWAQEHITFQLLFRKYFFQVFLKLGTSLITAKHMLLKLLSEEANEPAGTLKVVHISCNLVYKILVLENEKQILSCMFICHFWTCIIIFFSFL